MYFGAHVKASGGVWTAIERGEAPKNVVDMGRGY